MSTQNMKSVFVVGAGVIGLSTAIRAQEAGYDVTIFAEMLPGERGIKYTSPWAGANHLSVASSDDRLQQSLDQETLAVFLDLLKDPKCPIMLIRQIEYRDAPGPDAHLAYLETFQPDFRWLKKSELPEGVDNGATFSTITIDVPFYLKYLLDRFVEAGGKAFRVHLGSLGSLLDLPSLSLECLDLEYLPSSPVAIVNCTGLGARSLSDVSDDKMYPTRGQVVLLRAPWAKNGMSRVSSGAIGGLGTITYIIPRRSGDCIIGGVFEPNDSESKPRPETTRSIEERAITLCPELLPPEKRANGTIDDLDVIEVCTGHRPTRKGGIRLEIGTLDKTAIPVVHNYGHGGAGYQSSWGSARAAVELLDKALHATHMT